MNVPTRALVTAFVAGALAGLAPGGAVAQTPGPGPTEPRTATASPMPSGWLEAAKREVLASEYEFSAVGDAVQAPNRALEIAPRASGAWR